MMKFIKVVKFIAGILLVFNGIHDIIIDYPHIDHWKNLAVVLIILYLFEPIVDKEYEKRIYGIK